MSDVSFGTNEDPGWPSVGSGLIKFKLDDRGQFVGLLEF